MPITCNAKAWRVKPKMVIAEPQRRCLERYVAVVTVVPVIYSGGQSAGDATHHLNAIVTAMAGQLLVRSSFISAGAG